MTRHLKREVMTQLKYPIYDLVRVDETTAIKAALQAESLLGIDPDILTGADATILGHVAEARRLMGEAMAPQVAGYARAVLDGGVEKLVIFYWHVSVGNILEHALGNYGLVRVDGRTSASAKEAAVSRFRHDPGCRVIIGNTLALGVGTDGLQHAAAYAIIGEPDWVPANNQQPIDRLDRGGQTRTVQADIMVAPGSIAVKVLASALRKLNVTNNVLDRRVVA
jgi:SNF2 family DNA or RNA helicase